MLMPQRWITEILSAETPGWSVSADELDAGYVRVGFETEGYEPLEEITGPLVFGIVEEIEELTEFKKPIRYCHVNVGSANGSGELQNIICGARNFAEGDTVIVALPGTVLPGGFEISARKTYGKISEGMLCSAMELGLCKVQNPGIITLPSSAGKPGDDAQSFLRLEDTVFDVNVTPDRGYALSARGLSREIASAFNIPFRDPALDPTVVGLGIDVPEVQGECLRVKVEDDKAVRRFGVRQVTGIDPHAQSPFWMQRELMLCGQRPVNAATDITNYVMFLLGQPMHAFDADKIDGGLTLRFAQKGEKLTTLDGVSRELNEEDLIISDDTQIQSMAGLMGGSTSEISDETTNVYFEAANFDAMTIARAGRRHKLSSEASRRFERGVDPALVEVALDIAASLLASIAGGTIAAGRTLVGEVPAMPTIRMAEGRPSSVAGMDYGSNTTVNRLKEVGASVEVTEETSEDGSPILQVTPPTWRPDLTMQADLVEEVVRLEGIERIPSIVPQAPAGRGLTPRQQRRRWLGHAAAWSGWTEILPTPFIANDTFDQWGLSEDDPRRNVVKVVNPLEADSATLGTTLLPSMLDSLKRNVSRGHSDVSLYGVEQVSFARGAGHSPILDVSGRPSEQEITELLATLPRQPLHIAAVACGQWEQSGSLGGGRSVEAMDAIEFARTVARACKVEFELANVDYMPWHPGRCAGIFLAGSEDKTPDSAIGFAGELHPQVCERLGLPARTVAVEIDVDAIPYADAAVSPQLSPFPAVFQDVAVVVEDTVPAETLRRVLRSGAGEYLESIDLFDTYRSASLGRGKISMTFSMRFRAPDRTLTDEECSAARDAAVELAGTELGATMRA